jgi:hypothetical protein
VTAVAAALVGFAIPAQADDAKAVLRSMTDYVASQKTISLTYDSSIEIVTPTVEKIQFTSSGDLLLSRPDKIRATRSGGYAHVLLVSDGKTVTLYGEDLNAYAQAEAPASIDKLVDVLRTRFGTELPGADLLLAASYEALSADVIEAKHIGRGIVEGVECEHLAFRTMDTDWQIWIEVGPKPIPHKYVITSKATAGAPEYALVIRSWKTDVQPAADAFVFKPSPGAKKVDFAALGPLDEVPPGMQEGMNQ